MNLKKRFWSYFSGLSSSAIVAVMYFFTPIDVKKYITSDVKSVSKFLDSTEKLNETLEKTRKNDHGNRTTTPIRGTNRRKAAKKIHRNGRKIRASKEGSIRENHKASRRG